MTTRTLIAVLLAATVAVAAVGAFLLWDDGPMGGASSPAKGTAKAGRPGDPSGPAGQAAPGGSPAADTSGAPTASGSPLSPKEEQALRSALEAIARDAVVRGALTAGVDQPWPLPASQELFKSCLESLKWSGPVGPSDSKEQTCSCAARAVQQLYPKDPPNPGTRNARQAYERSIREQIELCTPP